MCYKYTVEFSIHKKFIIFCFVGAVSTVIDIFLLFLLHDALSLNLYFSATIAFLSGSTNGYLMNHKFTFLEKRGYNMNQYSMFIATSIVGLLLTLVFLKLFVSYVGLTYIIAKLITVVLVVFWTFSASHFITFRKK